MRRYEFSLAIDLFERIKLLAKKYDLSMPKMINKLLEIGYIKMITMEVENETYNK